MSFYPEEAERIEDSLLVLLGVQPDQLEQMSVQLRADVLEIYTAREALKRGKMPGQQL